MKSFEKVLSEVESFVKSLGLSIHYTYDLEPFFKGDLNGKDIWIADNLSVEEKLFNLLHLAGHCIQWNTNANLRILGSKIHKNPSPLLLSQLMEYEYDAAKYSLEILNKTENWKSYSWLNRLVKQDMLDLYNFYTTGKKLKQISTRIFKYQPLKEALAIPIFKAIASEGRRNGIVMSF